MTKTTILITGAVGFIGFYTSLHFLRLGVRVIGIDNLNDYYSVQLKQARLKQIQQFPNFEFFQVDLADRVAIDQLFQDYQFDRVIHLGAQAGVRHSLVNPHGYIDANVTGTLHILEGCRNQQVPHLVYASSSSIYGNNTKLPFCVDDPVNHPISLYAATKKANELMAHTYSHLFRIPTTGLRFFTVYGPWGRPDMAVYKFTEAIFQGRPIDVYNHGQMERDFTYIDDIVTAIALVADKIPAPDPTWDALNPRPGTSDAPYRIFNVGNHRPEKLMDFIRLLEQAIGRQAVLNFLPMQPGDVPTTYADVEALEEVIDFTPSTPLDVGIPKFVQWYREYNSI